MTTTNLETTSVADEIAAMRRIVAALDKLDPATQERVAAWLFDRYRQPIDETT